MLDQLRKAITDKTAPVKFPQEQQISRTFNILTSPGMEGILKWYKEWFPVLDDDAGSMHPWITPESSKVNDKGLHEAVSSAVTKAFGADLANALSSKGFRIIDGANQVIFIGDITDPDFTDAFTENHDAVVQAFQNIGVDDYFKIGLFLISTPLGDNDAGTFLRTDNEDLQRLLQSCSDKLDKVFLLDISNSSNTIIANPDDMHFLLGQLLYMLTIRPINDNAEGRINRYREWVSRSGIADHKVNGFSGISLLAPVDQIAETILVKRAGFMLEEAFFGDLDKEKAEHYKVSLLNDMSLNSYETLVSTHQKTLINPLSDLKDFDLLRPEYFIVSAGVVDSGMAQYVDINENIIRELNERHRVEFKYALEDHIATAMSRDEGSMVFLPEFLKGLKEHIQMLLPEEKPASEYTEPSGRIKDLDEILKAGPSLEAVTARSIVLSGIFIFGAFMIGLNSLFLFAVLVVMALLSTASSVFYWKGWNNRVIKDVNWIQDVLYKKWDGIVRRRTHDIFEEILPEYLEIIDSVEKKLQNAGRRLEHVVQFYKDSYTASEPVDSAFWIYPVKDRSAFEKYESLMSPYGSEVVHQLVRDEKPLELWSRLSMASDDDMNAWEWGLAEKAALRLLPYSENLFNISICQILQEFPDVKDNMIDLFRRSALPFIRYNARSGSDLSGSLEVHNNCDLIAGEIIDAIEGEYANGITIASSGTPYRISLLSMSEGVEMNYIKTGEVS